jgi:hypothetical protein
MQVQIDKTKEEIQEKKRQMRLLEQRINSADIPQLIANPQEMSQVRGGFLLMVTLIMFSFSQNRQLLFKYYSLLLLSSFGLWVNAENVETDVPTQREVL